MIHLSVFYCIAKITSRFFRLFFRRNSIQRLGRFSLSGLSELETLDLHDNRIESLAADSFRDLRRLKDLDLSLNVVGTVGDTLEPLGALMKLNLSDNYITSLPRNAFHSLRRWVCGALT